MFLFGRTGDSSETREDAQISKPALTDEWQHWKVKDFSSASCVGSALELEGLRGFFYASCIQKG